MVSTWSTVSDTTPVDTLPKMQYPDPPESWPADAPTYTVLLASSDNHIIIAARARNGTDDAVVFWDQMYGLLLDEDYHATWLLCNGTVPDQGAG